ncbi:hypothetical protein IQ07DRAFT_636781 [Pyrenochaeta sp. DS3sAY3a]|nr:hypothetical protein IQ07DRAFT_636781 [Pyrenochaeta sp. DS3sAY3a]
MDSSDGVFYIDSLLPHKPQAPLLGEDELDTEDELFSEDEVETQSDIESLSEVNSEIEVDAELTNDGHEPSVSPKDNSANTEPTQHFRLMDLATELRVKITEYALTDKKDLKWKWTKHMYGVSKAGTFKGTTTLANLTAISRVSHQLYNETKNLVWKLNTFCFLEADDVDLYFRDSDMSDGEDENFGDAIELQGVTSAVQFLGRVKQPWPVEHIQHVKVIRRPFDYIPKTRYCLVDAISSLAGMIPEARVTLRDYNWVLREGHPHDSAENLEEFVYEGLAMSSYNNSRSVPVVYPRNWKIFPVVDSWALEWLDSITSEDGINMRHVELAKEYIHHGLDSVRVRVRKRKNNKNKRSEA